VAGLLADAGAELAAFRWHGEGESSILESIDRLPGQKLTKGTVEKGVSASTMFGDLLTLQCCKPAFLFESPYFASLSAA
jgi:hypothetical protein